jgi:hypothetical protein
LQVFAYLFFKSQVGFESLGESLGVGNLLEALHASFGKVSEACRIAL